MPWSTVNTSHDEIGNRGTIHGHVKNAIRNTTPRSTLNTSQVWCRASSPKVRSHLLYEVPEALLMDMLGSVLAQLPLSQGGLVGFGGS